MKVSVNDVMRTLPNGATVADAVATLKMPTDGVAAALNDAVVPRSAWDSTAVAEGDTVEVVAAVQGG